MNGVRWTAGCDDGMDVCLPYSSMRLDSLLSCFALLHPPSQPALFCSAPRLPLIPLCFAPLYLGGGRGGAGGPRRGRGWRRGRAFRARGRRILGASGQAPRSERPDASSAVIVNYEPICYAEIGYLYIRPSTSIIFWLFSSSFYKMVKILRYIESCDKY